MRHRIFIGLCLICLGAWGNAPASDEGFGLGIIVGEPTGLSAKVWLSENSAFDAAAAWSFEGEDALHLHGDFLLHRFDLNSVDDFSIPFYYGLGGRIKQEDDDSLLGVRLPLGLLFLWEDERIDFFIELVPIMDLAPDTDFRLNGGVGVRYYFGGSKAQ
jgi:hypothetical protein